MSQKYIGTKIVIGEAMTRAAYNEFRGWTLPDNENGADEGYLVEYQDGGKPNVSGREGYVSWSPKEQFDNAYRPCEAMTFGLALEVLKRGQRVARAGWNGKGMFAYLVPKNAYPAQTGAAKAFFGDGALVPYNAYFALKGVDGTVSTWAPSGSDSLAEDWQIVDAATSSVPDRQPPVDNAHVAPGCEKFSDTDIEHAIKAKGLTAPRVTPADIKANIAGEFYFTAGQAAAALGAPRDPVLDLLTFCVIKLRNGFTVSGESACASPENFDAEIGRKIARENAVNKVWPLMGYALKEQLARAADTSGLPG